jgi:hypothetical protein
MSPRLLRTDRGKNHSYRLDDRKVDGVTTVLNAGLPKPALLQWAADMAASYAVDHLPDLAEMSTAKAVDAIRYAHRDRSRAAMARGSEIHALGEPLAHGKPVEVPDALAGPVNAYARFLDRWGIEAIASETPVASTVARYAGTADLWATVAARDGRRALIDLKTGKDAYSDVALQLAAYRHADLWQPDGPDSEEDLPPVDLVYVALILPDDVRMIPVRAGEREWTIFRYVQQVARWTGEQRWNYGEPPTNPVLLPDAQPDREDVPA